MLKKLYHKLFPDFIFELEKELEGNESFLDLACGVNTPIKKYSKKYYSVGIDLFKPSIEESQKKGLHKEYINKDVLNETRKLGEKSFDCVVALDFIEHLSKEDGNELIKNMEKIAKKKVIIFTPNGFLKQGEHSGNKWQKHISGWNVEEMKKKGYSVKGIEGYKKIRGEFAKIKYKPFVFWRVLSDVSQKFMKNHPKQAFAILCVKNIK